MTWLLAAARCGLGYVVGRYVWGRNVDIRQAEIRRIGKENLRELKRLEAQGDRNRTLNHQVKLMCELVDLRIHDRLQERE